MNRLRIIENTSFHEVLKWMNDKREQERDWLATQVHAVPVPDAIFEKLVNLGPADLRHVLRHHPGDATERKYQSVRVMHSMFQQAVTDLLAQLDLFHEQSAEPGYHTRTKRHINDGIRLTICKEIMALSVAAASLEELERNANRVLSVSGYSDMIARVFDPHEHEFVTELRNAMAHYSAPEAASIIRWDKEGRSTDFYLDTCELKTYKKFNSRAKTFLRQAAPHILIRPLVTSYASRVRAFVTWFSDAVDASPSASMADYRRIRDAAHGNSARVTYRMLLPMFISSGVDPYTKLGDYLTPDEVKTALHLPLRSREQVDFIITCVDEFDACDDEIRGLVYKLFQVRGAEAAS